MIGASTVEMETPHDLKLPPAGKHLFVSDSGNDSVVKYLLTVQ